MRTRRISRGSGGTRAVYHLLTNVVVGRRIRLPTSGCDEILANSEPNEARGFVHPKLLHEAGAVTLDRPHRDVQRRGDLRIGPPGSQLRDVDGERRPHLHHRPHDPEVQAEIRRLMERKVYDELLNQTKRRAHDRTYVWMAPELR